MIANIPNSSAESVSGAEFCDTVGGFFQVFQNTFHIHLTPRPVLNHCGVIGPCYIHVH